MRSRELQENTTSIPRAAAILVCIIAVAALVSGSAMAGHGVAIAKDCFKAQRCQKSGDPDPTTGLPLDCNNNDACDGVETCDETGTNIMRCDIELSYNDEFGDTIQITAATDNVDPDGTAGVGPITVPIGGGNLPISEVSGNTTCVVGPFAACTIGPPDGYVVFRHEHGLDGMVGYVIDADDPNFIPDRATVTVQDSCDQPAGQDSCNELPNNQQFGSNTKVEDGCLPGTPPNCNDGNECTNDSCDPALGCQNIDRSAECDDGNECTADSCDPATGCVNDDISANCDDNNECTADSCDPAIGCVNDDISANCNDNNECTADSCDPATGCVNDDISADCDDNNECTADSCDPATGCVNDDISADCDDNNECTADSCDPATGCVNDDISANCNDNNECTADSCDPAIGCVNDDISADCDDNNECTADSCDPATGCVNDDISADCDDNNECTADSCDPATGCVNDDISADCDDNNECTADSCDPATGCVNNDISADCDDNNECTADSCDPATGCVNDDISANCNDNNECTADSCDPAIGCVNDDISADCDDNNECTADSCDPATGCVNDDISADCDDNNECTADSCDPATGCVNDDISADCDDSNECTADSCDPATGCVNDDISADCDDNNECTADSCDPATGCVNDDISADCDDNNECTADSCDPATGCVNDDISANCDDGNACTADSCDPAIGCVNMDISASCDDGNACTADSCDRDTGCVNDDISADCNDNNECTADSCDPAIGCVNDDISADCNDNNECTADSCDPAIGCVNDDISADCNDDNECTADSCDPATGCVNEDTSAECVDDNPCTDDSCDPAVGCQNVCAPDGKAACTIVIGDYIWSDENNDGLQTGEEDNGIEGVTVELLDCSGAAVEVDSTTTDEDGYYEFEVVAEDCDLSGESLQVVVTDDDSVLDGFMTSPEDVDDPASDAIDSDCDDAGATECTMHDYGTSDATIDCGFFPPACEVDVVKTCCVVPPASPPTGNDCDGKITSMMLEYTGDGCDVITNPQEGKAVCTGAPGTPPVELVVGDNHLDKVYYQDPLVYPGDVFFVEASTVGDDEFKADTRVVINGGEQDLKFHTSCSKSILVGDQFGSIRIVQMTSTDGGTVDLPVDEPEDPNASLCVPPTPPGPPHCKGKVVEAVFEYTGGACGDSANTQGDKFGCSGRLDGDEDVSILVTKDITAVMVDPSMGINLGDLVTFTATGNELKSSLKLNILKAGAVPNPEDENPDDVLQSLDIHTSCSAPLNLGDVFGSLTLVELTTTEGGTVTMEAPEPPEPTDACEIPAPGPFPCDEKVGEITLQYTGGDCDATTNQQEGKATCQDYADASAPARVIVFKDSDIFLDTALPTLDAIVVAQASAAGRTSFHSETFITILDEFDNPIQELNIHTSCSKALDIGDVFGAMTIVGLKDKYGKDYTPGALVEFSYEITNHGDFDVEIDQVVDDPLGVIEDESFVLGAGESVVLRTTETITENHMNTVTVDYSQFGAECRPETDSATVTVEETPDVVECTSKIKKFLFEYTGDPVPGPVTVTVEPSSNRNDPAVHELPGGLMPGMVLDGEAGWTVDATLHGETDLGSKTSLFICSPTTNCNEAEVFHTSCSTPFVAGQPAPLDSPKGAPSPNWFVVTFEQK